MDPNKLHMPCCLLTVMHACSHWLELALTSVKHEFCKTTVYNHITAMYINGIAKLEECLVISDKAVGSNPTNAMKISGLT